MYEYKVGRYTVWIGRYGTNQKFWGVYDSLELGAGPIMKGFATRKAALAAAHKELGGN